MKDPALEGKKQALSPRMIKSRVWKAYILLKGLLME